MQSTYEKVLELSIQLFLISVNKINRKREKNEVKNEKGKLFCC